MEDSILTNPTQEELISATEANYITYFKGFACLPQCTFVQNDEFTWLLCDGPPGNAVLHTHLDPSRANQRITEQLRLLTGTMKGRSGWWQVLPSCQPADLADRLHAHGLTAIEGRPVMTLDMQTLPSGLSLPPECHIERVRDERMLQDWLVASAAGFEADIAKIQVYFDAYACMGIGEEQSVQHYVGYLQDQPVTSSTLLLAGGIAGVYDVSTAPHARGQGLGRAISLAPLLEARRRGYRYAVLQSSPAGHPVYAQLGFTDLYREVNYRWTASTFSL